MPIFSEISTQSESLAPPMNSARISVTHGNACISLPADEVSPSFLNKNKDLRFAIDFTADVLDARYSVLTWCESKMNILVTLDGLLLAASFMMIGANPPSHVTTMLQWWQLFTELGSICLLIASLFSALLHIFPLMDSRTGTGNNPRSIISVRKFVDWHQLKEHVEQMSDNDRLSRNCEQMYGMGINILTSERAIRRSAFFACSALLFFFAQLLICFFERQ